MVFKESLRKLQVLRSVVAMELCRLKQSVIHIASFQPPSYPTTAFTDVTTSLTQTMLDNGLQFTHVPCNETAFSRL